MGGGVDSHFLKYGGGWFDEQGNRLEIRPIRGRTALVSYFAAPEGKPLPRPWLENKLSVEMVGEYDPSEGVLEVELGRVGAGFTLHLTLEPEYELDGYGRDSLVPGLSRFKEDDFFDQFYHLFPLGHFTRGTSGR
jgi:hypothetical protein